MTMDKLFDGSDAHLLGANAELIQRLRTHAYYTAFPKPISEAADALEAADKRIAELERKYLDSVEVNTALQHGLYEKERKLAVAREAMKLASDQARKCDSVPCRSTLLEALAQIGGGE